MTQPVAPVAPDAPTPQHSRLYHLEPAGLNSPLVESLVSYMSRLAAEHGVPPTQFIAQEIAPLVNKRYSMTLDAGLRFLADARHALALCGSGPIAAEWIAGLERLTGWDSLAPLTLIHLNRFVSTRTPDTLRRERAWCPQCISKWREEDAIPYTPLIWMIREVTRCPVHHIPLMTQCPNASCGKTATWRIGHYHQTLCVRCDTWLGQSDPAPEPEPVFSSLGKVAALSAKVPAQANEEHVADRDVIQHSETVGALLRMTQHQAAAVASQLAQQLSEQISTLSSQRLKRLHRQTGMTCQMAQAWGHGTYRPTLRQFLGICRILEVSIPGFLNLSEGKR